MDRAPSARPHRGTGARAGLTLRTRLVAALLLATAALLGVSAGAASAAPAPTETVSPVAPVPAQDSDRDSSADRRVPAGVDVDLRKLNGKNGTATNPVALVLLLGALSLLPAVLIMVTAFTRIVIVLGFTRSALGTQGVPPNQVLIGLALFLTLFVMGPVFSTANEQALQPYLKGTMSQSEAYERGLAPFRAFMLEQVREKDLQLFVDMSGKGQPAKPADVPTTTLVPAFVISELRTAFLIGFVVFIPFVVLDLVVSAALSAMGMAMLPPSLISLPFKLLLFVAVDGWYLLTSSLVRSFA